MFCNSKNDLLSVGYSYDEIFMDDNFCWHVKSKYDEDPLNIALIIISGIIVIGLLLGIN